MLLNENAVEEFKNLYLQEYKISLTDQQVTEYGTRLIQLVKAVYGNNLPMPKNVDKEAKKGNNERVLNRPIAFFNGRLRQSEQLG